MRIGKMNPTVRMICGKCDFEFDVSLKREDDPIFSISHWGECMDCPSCDMTYHFTVDGNKKKPYHENDFPF